MIICPPGSKRSIEAIARTNYLHSHFRRHGKISDSDMLFTLSLFALEGIRWIERYDWRALSDVERCAIATFWKSLGEDMGVSYEGMRACEKGWKDGLEWLEELDEWSRGYEEKFMVFSEDNVRLGEATVELLLWQVPRRFKGVARNFVSCLLSPRLRKAMK
jgi:hypothetical protein